MLAFIRGGFQPERLSQLFGRRRLHENHSSSELNLDFPTSRPQRLPNGKHFFNEGFAKKGFETSRVHSHPPMKTLDCTAQVDNLTIALCNIEGVGSWLPMKAAPRLLNS